MERYLIARKKKKEKGALYEYEIKAKINLLIFFLAVLRTFSSATDRLIYAKNVKKQCDFFKG